MSKKLGLLPLLMGIGLMYLAGGQPVLAPVVVTPTVEVAQLDLLLTTKQYQAAVNLLEQLATTYPDLPHPLLQMGQIYLAQRRYPLAIDAFNRARARDPNNSIALAGLAEATLQQGHLSDSLILWQQAAAHDPRHQAGLGRVYLAQLNFAAAQQAFSRYSSSETAWYLAALTAPRNPHEAHTYLTTITTTPFISYRDYLSPTLAPFLSPQPPAHLAKTVGIALSQLAQWPLAWHALQLASPTDPETLAFLGQAQAKLGLPAFDTFDQAAKGAPDSVLVLTLAGQYLRQQRAFQAALTRFAQAAQLDRDNAAIFAEIALTQNELGDLDAAEQWYQVAIATANEKLNFRLMLAQFYVERNYHLKTVGLPFMETLMKLYPDDPRVHDLHGWMLFLSGDPQAAETALRKALDLNPDFIAARYHFARVLAANGKAIEATAAYQAVIDGDMQGSWRELAQKAIIQ